MCSPKAIPPEEQLLRIAASLEARSEHPLARAVVRALSRRDRFRWTDFRAVGGKGVTGTLEGKPARLRFARIP